MPQCFQLFAVQNGIVSIEPADLNYVDQQLCELLNKPVDKTHYVAGWFDAIGWQIAVNNLQLGTDALRQKIKEFESENLNKCLEFLENNYSSTSFYATNSKLKRLSQ